MELLEKKFLCLTLFWTLAFNPLIVNAEGQQEGVAAEDEDEKVALMIHARDLENGEVLVWKKEMSAAEIFSSKRFDENEYLEAKNSELEKVINGLKDYLQGYSDIVKPEDIAGYFERSGYTLTTIRNDDDLYYTSENYTSTISEFTSKGKRKKRWGIGIFAAGFIVIAGVFFSSVALPATAVFWILLGGFSGFVGGTIINDGGIRHKELAKLLEQDEAQQNTIKTLVRDALEKWRERESVDDEASVFSPLLPREQTVPPPM